MAKATDFKFGARFGYEKQ